MFLKGRARSREIRDGKLADRYHTHVALTGYVPDLLGSVSMVGNKIKLDARGCGKGYKAASLAGNPPHTLPGPDDLPDVLLKGLSLAERPLEVIEE